MIDLEFLNFLHKKKGNVEFFSPDKEDTLDAILGRFVSRKVNFGIAIINHRDCLVGCGGAQVGVGRFVQSGCDCTGDFIYGSRWIDAADWLCGTIATCNQGSGRPACTGRCT